MTDVAAFVLARLDEDEQAVKALYESPLEGQLTIHRPIQTWTQGHPSVEVSEMAQRVLAQVAALRAVVHQAEMLAEYVDATREHEAYRYEPTLHRLLVPLAGIWADHPDYDPAWGA